MVKPVFSFQKTVMQKAIVGVIFLTLYFLCANQTIEAQTTAFTYQGKLADNGTPLTGNYDFEFRLFDDATVGAPDTQHGETLTRTNVLVNAGIFTVQLDFVPCASCPNNECATCFNGAARFLDISVRPAGGGAYTQLAPRQPVTSNPYAIKSKNAATADGLSVACVSCVTSSQIQSVNGSAVTGTIPLASIPAGSNNYIQNTTSPQALSNFNIDGNGIVGGNLGVGATNPLAKLSVSGNTAGSGDNTANFENSAIGPNLSHVHFGTTGDWYIRSAASAGKVVLQDLGGSVSIGTPLTNSSKLYVEGFGGPEAAMYVRNANFAQVDGVGIEGIAQYRAGFGTGGVFTGGKTGVSGTANAEDYTGYSYGVHGLATGTNGFKVGVLGRSSVFPGTSLGYGVWGIAEGAGSTKYGVYGEALGPGTNWAGYFNGDTHVAGKLSVVTSLGVGVVSPTFKLQVIDSSNTGLRVQTNAAGGTVASFGGNGAFEIDKPGIPGGRFRVAENGAVSIGVFGGGGDLTVNGNALINTLTISNGLTVNILGSAGSTALCRNASNLISTCSSSLRYKQNINSFDSGLSVINRLRPVSFNWKANGEADLGLGAEDVAKVEPLLVTQNDKGEIEGVKYDRITVVLINAVKEQQQQIESLKRIVCRDHPKAEICKEPARTSKVSKITP